MNRRFTAVLAPLLALSLAACGGEAGTESKKPADPKQAVTGSTAALADGNYSFALTMPGDDVAKGSVHLPSKSASLTMTMNDADAKGDIQFRIVDPNRYMKITMDMTGEDMPSAEELAEMAKDPQMGAMAKGLIAMLDMFSGKYWMKVDMSKLKDADMQISLDDADLVGVKPLLDSVVTAEGSGTSYKGTLDATKGKAESGQALSDLAGIPAEQAKALPYEATLDDQGRLTKLVLDVPKVDDTPAGKWTIDYTGYGAATAQQAPPAGEIKEMGKEGYDMLNK